MFLRSVPNLIIQQSISRPFLNYKKANRCFHGLKFNVDEKLYKSKTIKCRKCSSYCSNSNQIQYESLPYRGLVRLSGEGVHEFLQGLMTNDINHLQSSPSLYTLFLNTKGRILYDSIIYKYNDILLVESDIREIDNFVKHLKMYRVRRKIDIDNVSDVLNVGVMFDPNQNLTKNCDVNGTIKDIEQLVPCSTIYEHDSSFEQRVKDLLVEKKNVFIYRDPRLSALGVRLINSKDLDLNSSILNKNSTQKSGDSYITVRYKLGVAEGIEEIPVGNSFPHEYNCDYLHGVSFHKGCYIGQELTARTQHTGVVRKRVMPLYFEDTVDYNDLTKDSLVEDAEKLIKINIGKVRGIHEKYGLALLRIAEALKVNKLKVKNAIATTTKPSWWPIEASKIITNKAKELS